MKIDVDDSDGDSKCDDDDGDDDDDDDGKDERVSLKLWNYYEFQGPKWTLICTG